MTTDYDIRRRATRTTIAVLLSGAMSSCAPVTHMNEIPNLDLGRKPQSVNDLGVERIGMPAKPTGVSQDGPTVPVEQPKASSQNDGLPQLKGPAKSVALEQVPLPSFIETIFGKLLGLTYQVDPQIAARQDLVTLRTTGDREPNDILQIAQEVLKTYGIRLQFNERTVRIIPDQVLAAQIPQIIRGRSSVDVSADMRPIFQIVPLVAANSQDMQLWITSALGTKVKMTGGGTTGNFLMLFGLPEDVNNAVDMVRILDQPRMAGKQSKEFEPAFWPVDKLSKKLIEVLKAEGYPASLTTDANSVITLIPIDTTNSLLVFANDNKTLQHVDAWIRDLDRPAKADPTQSIFVYPVRNTLAESLGAIISDLVSGSGTVGSSGASQGASATRTAQPPSLSQGGLQSTLPGQGVSSSSTQSASPGVGSATTASGGRIVIDGARNALIFKGSAEEYSQILPLMQNLDRAPLEALIEVTVAEVTLTEKEGLGIEWSAPTAIGGGYAGVIGTLGNGLVGAKNKGSAPTSAGGGLTYTVFNSAGVARGILNAYASDNRLRVLSTPRIVAQSGTSATIKVGDEIPIITAQVSSGVAVGGTTGIQNSVQYRSTGISLKVKPTVHSADRIDLEIDQEVSNVDQSNTSAATGNPTILTRSVSTKLALRDGVTVLLGGMIQDQRGNNASNIPFIQDIPGLSYLFRNQATSIARTELLIFITPYSIKSNEDSVTITEKIRKGMSNWPEISGKIN